MKVARLEIEHFRGIERATLELDGHTLLVGDNNVGKSTICEALELVLGPERLSRTPLASEHDFYNSGYLDADDVIHPIRVEVTLLGLSDEVRRLCAPHLEHWHRGERRILGSGELPAVDDPQVEECLRLVARVEYDREEDDFSGATYFVHSPDAPEGELKIVSMRIKRALGFLYLRALRTGARAFSLERGSLLDVILRLKDARTGLWEQARRRLKELDPPIDETAESLRPILEAIETRLAEYISLPSSGGRTRLFVSQLTREHLRRTLSFFLSVGAGQQPVPFQQAGTGTLNILVLALLTFIAETKADVIFAMEEPEIALPPHTQRRIVSYLLKHTSQCFVTSHSPYVIERFDPEQILVVRRDEAGAVEGKRVHLPSGVRASTYRMHLRRAIAEAMLGRGVIVSEGLTEQMALTTAAQKIQEAEERVPLDTTGVAIVNTGGDGNLGELGVFFKDLGLKTFAFYDQKDRRPEEAARIAQGFDINRETTFRGCERLLVTETPIERQWQFLEDMRSRDDEGKYGIPVTQPDDERVRAKTEEVLKATKGDGGAACLLSFCTAEELPTTIATFLREVFDKFPASMPEGMPLVAPEIVLEPAEPMPTEPASHAIAPDVN